MSKITGTVKSEQGFYIGDLCYALADVYYEEIWGVNGYDDGIYEVPGGYKFAVAGTAYGDGTYEDYQLRQYDVDAGNISLVPGELAESTGGGHYFPGAGEATFTAEDGVFEITLPSGEKIIISTGYRDDFYYEDDYEEEEDYDEYEDE